MGRTQDNSQGGRGYLCAKKSLIDEKMNNTMNYMQVENENKCFIKVLRE